MVSAPGSDRGNRSDEAVRLHSHEPTPVHRRPGLRSFDEAEFQERRRVRRAPHRSQGLSILSGVRGQAIPARRRRAQLAQRRPAVVHAAALHAARADGLSGARGRGRSGRVRGRRHLRAPVPRHGRQGDHVPHPRRGEAHLGWQLCLERDAAGLREADATGRSRSSSASCSRSRATIAAGSICNTRSPARSDRSSRSGTTSTG